MQIFKKYGSLIGVFLLVGSAGFLVGQRYNTSSDKPSQQALVPPALKGTKQDTDTLTCPVDINAGEFKEFFNIGNEVPIIGKPIIISTPSVQKLSRSFRDREREINKIIAGEPGEERDRTLGIYEIDKFDVDNDGKDETIMGADLYMNHRPHMAMIVKNGNLIFEASGGGIGIKKVYENTGFTLEEEVDRTMGEYLITRYIPKDGGFMAIWTQKICYAQFRK